MSIYRGKGSKRAQAALDGRIAAIYSRLAQGRSIDVFDIGRVFGAARSAHERGRGSGGGGRRGGRQVDGGELSHAARLSDRTVRGLRPGPADHSDHLLAERLADARLCRVHPAVSGRDSDAGTNGEDGGELMGDRANVYIREDNDHGVYLYTHWGGYELPEVVRRALARGESRWSDAPYLARIVFL